MTQKPEVRQLLPVGDGGRIDLQKRWDYIYEPDAGALLDGC